MCDRWCRVCEHFNVTRAERLQVVSEDPANLPEARHEQLYNEGLIGHVLGEGDRIRVPVTKALELRINDKLPEIEVRRGVDVDTTLYITY